MEKMGKRLSVTIKGKQVMGMQEVALDSMTYTQSRKMTMEELFQSRQQEEPVEVESNDFESESYQGSGETVVVAFDPNEEETQVWLKRIGRYEFACLPWDAWAENEFAEQQWNMIKEGEGVIIGDVCLTPKLVSKVFKILYLSVPAKGRKVTNSHMKGEFGNPIGANSYYMVRNAGEIRAANLFWYLEKVCILQKIAYMSKEAFAPLYQAERGIKVDWATVLYDQMQLTGYANSIGFEDNALMEEGVDLEEPNSRVNFFSMGSEFKKSESKEGSSASHGAMGIFSVEVATNCLTDLSKFLQSQDEEKSDKEKLQEEVTRLTTQGKAMTSEILSVAEDFQQWVDGLKTAVDEQFKELDEKVVDVTTENDLLMNRLSPLAEIEKAVLQGQGMTKVLVADSKADALKKEVLEYTQEMWNRATKLWREHMAVSTDQFKNWFLCADQDSVKRENEALKIENEWLVAEMKEMRNNHKEIEDSLSKLKAELSSGLLKLDRNLAVEAESDVEKQVDVDFVAKKAMEIDAKGDIGEQTT
ncbi:hypothetical protein L7F22_053167 [Adiantum nelumboides]|nr:hypothetical protein [Adiantum nelumboides]MCO5599068.1 hypothetical protein [Adiantum nelumboides]